MEKETAKLELLRRATNGKLTERDALAWMILLHTHQIRFRPGVLTTVTTNGNGEIGMVLSADTHHGVAHIIAALWPDREDERAKSGYWYWQYNSLTPYELMEDVPQGWFARVQELRQILERLPEVEEVVVEDT
jgi:hypothetical protein